MSRTTMISIVVPVHNEQENIPVLYAEVRDVLEQLLYDFELIFVDDGSRDESAEVVRRLRDDDQRVKLIRFSRNFGHQLALTAGLENAGGDAVIVMDADLQHPPAVIPELIARWKEGADVVYTIRKATEGASLTKRFTAAVFYWLINTLCETPVIENAADFRLMDRKVVSSFNRMRERNRFVRGMVSWVGYKQAAVTFVAGRRRAGETKYTFTKMLRFAANGITSFSTLPLRLATYLGFLAAVSGIPYALWAIYERVFTNAAVTGWASLIVAILFLGGVQLLCLGILGEYVGRIYEEVKGRPLYLLSEKLGFSRNEIEQRTDWFVAPQLETGPEVTTSELTESRTA